MDSLSYTAGVFDGTQPFLLGDRGTHQYSLDGSLDEVAIYKRALTSAERTWLYNNGAGRSYAEVSLPPTLTGVVYAYDPVHKHAVASTDNSTPSNTNDDNTYTYDANGNMTCRVEGGTTYKQDFNIENQLTAVSIMSGGCNGTPTSTTSFVYDGDGNLVKKIKPDASKTIYVGGAYEEDRSSGGTLTHTRFYYPAGGAMRLDGTLYYVLKDHLGSASVVTNASGTTVGEQRYYPFGETRFTSGNMYTDKLYTGQRDTGLGIYYYIARFYSPYINHFVSPDSIVPNPSNPQSWNRYSYVSNNPLKYTDPSGHAAVGDSNEGCRDLHQCKKSFLTRRAWDVAKSLKNKKDRNDVEAMTDIIDLGATLFKTNDELIPILSGIFLGTEESNPLTVLHAAQTNPCAAVGRAETDCAANKDRGSFGDAGFHEDFQDGMSQPFHFWAYLATAANTQGTGPASYIPGAATSFAGNIEHEIIVPDGAGATWQDYALARAGANIGTLVNMGMVPPDELGNTIRNYVGASGPGAFYVNPLKFLLPLQGNR